MSKSDTIDRGREAFQRGKWAEARSLFSAAEKEAPLEPEDLERLAKASYLVGKYSECIEFWTRVHNRFRDRGEANRAAYSAFWLGMTLFNRGDKAQGSGWMARARRRVRLHCGGCV
ncbi:MAG: hypothetical protein R3281_16365 [Balneolaceae bacterium]|nr:hypothetical protein [Balneolaceae bacterium]